MRITPMRITDNELEVVAEERTQMTDFKSDAQEEKDEYKSGYFRKTVLPRLASSLWEMLPNEVRKELRACCMSAGQQIQGRLSEWIETLNNPVVGSYIAALVHAKIIALSRSDKSYHSRVGTNPLLTMYGIGFYLNVLGCDEETVWLAGIVPIRLWRRLILDKFFRQRFMQVVQDLLSEKRRS